jgi:hypothetical protein
MVATRETTEPGGSMEYLALIYSDERRWDEFTDAERAAGYEKYVEFANAARAAGVLVGGEELASTRSATTVRIREGEQLVTDGPYAEAKEALGGYFLLDCPSFDDALDWAARIPAVETGAVEVRPVHVDEEA